MEYRDDELVELGDPIDPMYGGIGHETPGTKYVTRKGVDRVADEIIYGAGIMGRIRKKVDSVRSYFGR